MIAQFLEWLADVCCFGLFLYKWIIIAAVIMTWVSADPQNRIVQWIGRVTRPLWVWCENWMPVMMAHFSAYASILVVIFAQIVLPAEIRSLNLLFHGLTDAQEFLSQSGGHLLQGTSIVIQILLFFFICKEADLGEPELSHVNFLLFFYIIGKETDLGGA